jgi:predicted  nucleic acid-binding Zn-ribbon protein
MKKKLTKKFIEHKDIVEDSLTELQGISDEISFHISDWRYRHNQICKFIDQVDKCKDARQLKKLRKEIDKAKNELVRDIESLYSNVESLSIVRSNYDKS